MNKEKAKEEIEKIKIDEQLSKNFHFIDEFKSKILIALLFVLIFFTNFVNIYIIFISFLLIVYFKNLVFFFLTRNLLTQFTGIC